MKLVLSALALIAAVGCQGNANSDTQKTNTDNVPADNTEKNERDRQATAVTPGDQSESEADRNITKQIRQSVVGNDELSTTGKNVKIITADGVVTLRGPVKTLQEKTEIASLVKKVDGVKRVDNQLEIAAN